jgi:hypothetical protein
LRIFVEVLAPEAIGKFFDFQILAAVQEELMSNFAHRWKSILFVGTLGAALVAGGVPRTQAADSDCRERVHRAEQRLQQAIDRHGEHSNQAEKRRHELEEARRNCHDDHDDHDRDRH